MSYPDIKELSTAFTLCSCPEEGCSRQCTVCQSTTWEHGPCVRLLWNEHASSEAGKAAAQRFNDMVNKYKPGDMVPMPTLGPRPYVDPEQIVLEADVLTDAEIVERTSDFTEQMGMYLEPWQAAALRAILLHGGDVEIGLPRQHP